MQVAKGLFRISRGNVWLSGSYPSSVDIVEFRSKYKVDIMIFRESLLKNKTSKIWTQPVRKDKFLTAISKRLARIRPIFSLIQAANYIWRRRGSFKNLNGQRNSGRERAIERATCALAGVEITIRKRRGVKSSKKGGRAAKAAAAGVPKEKE